MPSSNLFRHRILQLVIVGFSFSAFLSIQSCKEEPKEDPEPLTVVITGFEPTKGIVGTVVTISGDNFSTAPEGNTVEFNGVAAVITSATATTIITKVPATATTGKIHLVADKKNVTSVAEFIVVLPPVITSFSPASGPIGSEVIITGRNFSLNANQNKITIGEVPLIVSDPTLTSIKVMITEGVATGKIKIEVNGFSVTSTNDFVVTPLIESVDPKSGPVGTVVTITGSGFSPTVAGNVVKFGTITATVSEATTTSIKVTVPAGAVTGKISVTTGGNSVESRSDFEVN
jgi:hypothetical protein